MVFIETGLHADGSGLRIPVRKTFSLFKTSTPALGPTQPPIERELGSLLKGNAAGRGHDFDYLPLASRLRMSGDIPPRPL